MSVLVVGVSAKNWLLFVSRQPSWQTGRAPGAFKLPGRLFNFAHRGTKHLPKIYFFLHWLANGFVLLVIMIVIMFVLLLISILGMME